MAVLNSGKHLYTEKPLAVERGEGQEMVATAQRKGLLVAGMTSTPFPIKPHPEGLLEAGKTFSEGTPTNVCGLLEFASGSIGLIAALGESGEGYAPRLEFYGERATLEANDPNMYCRPARLRGGEAAGDIVFDKGFSADGRGLGVAEMAWALRTGAQPRASGELMLHVLDLMHAIHEASNTRQHVWIETTCTRPQPFDLNEMLAAFERAK